MDASIGQACEGQARAFKDQVITFIKIAHQNRHARKKTRRYQMLLFWYLKFMLGRRWIGYYYKIGFSR